MKPFKLRVDWSGADDYEWQGRTYKGTHRAEIELHIAPLALCTDNAVMGAIAIERLRAGLVESLDLDITPGLVRE